MYDFVLQQSTSITLEDLWPSFAVTVSIGEQTEYLGGTRITLVLSLVPRAKAPELVR
jgi:hypothetical protein